MLSHEKWCKDKFHNERRQVLGQWPTGQEVQLSEAVAFHKGLPAEQNLHYYLLHNTSRTLIQPRGGRALLEQQLELIKYLADEGEADLLTVTVDGLTRQQRYKAVTRELEKCRITGKETLAGFPVVNHGVDGCRQLVRSTGNPVQLRHAAVDARLLAEVAVAGGMSSVEGGGISTNIPYLRDYDPELSLRHWQYVDYLLGWYGENGITINREPFGAMTGALVPPCISHAICILETLLAAFQGVASVTLSYGQCGNLIQDVAAIHTLPVLAKKYLQKFDLNQVALTTAFHQWMGGFPQDEHRAYGLIGWAAATAVLAGANKVLVKTPHEALGHPTKETIAAGLKTTLQVIKMASQQLLPDNRVLEAEKSVIMTETEKILDAVIDIADGDVAAGTLKAFKEGILDVPFAPSKYNAGRVLPARDLNGAVRFLDTGKLPFDKDLKEFHQEKMARRGETEGREPSFQMVLDDIHAISKGMLLGKPQ